MGPHRNVPGARAKRVRLGGGRHGQSLDQPVQVVAHRTLGCRLLVHHSRSAHYLRAGAQQSRRAAGGTTARALARTQCCGELALVARLRLRSIKINKPTTNYFYFFFCCWLSRIIFSILFLSTHYLYKNIHVI